LKYLSLQGKVYPEIFLNYYHAMSYYYSVAMIKKGNVSPVDAYEQVRSRLVSAPKVFKDYLNLFEYKTFQEDWQSIFELFKEVNLDHIETFSSNINHDLIIEIYTTSRFESLFFYKLLLGKKIFHGQSCNRHHAIDRRCYDVAWENVELILNDLGIEIMTERE
jgi:hypothetical protein